ncbi:MAG TPA: elongation factor P maturation arginine rhamnosyltransferase EarP [Macromonas sp.]|nr:elongation factor P maturation arginine rhamnosyltransferase EarP [Macromonas sp.]
MSTRPANEPLTWDIFCHVIDNWGDLGVCWRLAVQLAERGQRVRLWVDDASPLDWMAPGTGQGERPAVDVRHWPRTDAGALPPPLPPGDVLIEAFGCEIAPAWVQRLQPEPARRVWLNLEYLSAEAYVERCHRLPSPVLSGPLAGRTKWFFYPGFTTGTGGLLREADLLQRQASFNRQAWRQRQGLPVESAVVSLFCYEPAALPQALQHPDLQGMPWLVTHGRAWAAMQQALAQLPAAAPAVRALPALSQSGFDELLWSCDLNFVRGEDSLVRALWAGQPFVWHIYPQHDNAHHDKLETFLDWLQAPQSWRDFHRVWNGMSDRPLPRIDWPAWRACAQEARLRLLGQSDLVSQLLAFVTEKR